MVILLEVVPARPTVHNLVRDRRNDYGQEGRNYRRCRQASSQSMCTIFNGTRRWCLLSNQFVIDQFSSMPIDDLRTYLNELNQKYSNNCCSRPDLLHHKQVQY
ncbi:hypothetical protein GJ496_002823 [Pomphorhynchus laevis]|nr:hypothetical protein GJ496_002823 [Pomphorhynchus laevis]